ncbi:MAG: hypothetical protein ACOCP8_06145 [archaeon]
MEKTIKGYYGKSYNPCTIFYYNGWYVIENSKNINYTNDIVENGINVETLSDIDFFESEKEIEDLDSLIEEVEDYNS